MDIPPYGSALRALPSSAPGGVGDRIAAVGHAVGATDVVCQLVDFEQLRLTPLPTSTAHLDHPTVEPVDGTPAGRAFSSGRVVSEERVGGVRVWAPILEGTDPTGVVAMTLPGPLDEAAELTCREIGILAGLEVMAAARTTDLYNLIRRRKEMSLAASMQWDLLPPLRLAVPQVTSVGLLEPAYEVGGDCFDHNVDGLVLNVAMMDAMGHGVQSSLASSLAMGMYRHDRREGRTLTAMHANLDRVVAEHFGMESFVTGQLVRLELETGGMTWVNAGHPPPLLVRDGRVVSSLECRPSLPWGLGGELAELASVPLQPGDSVLFYTDGVIEGRSPIDREEFGIDRLVDLMDNTPADGDPTVDMLRQLTGAVRDYQGDELFDDATLLLVRWDGPVRPAEQGREGVGSRPDGRERPPSVR
jgi:serine phosphatase RsbU (regulator of sigma subunit)